jgi:hypothetical protein
VEVTVEPIPRAVPSATSLSLASDAAPDDAGSDRTAPERPALALGAPSRGFLALTGVVLAGAVAVRVALLGRQSDWIDEVFSVRTSSGSFAGMTAASMTEVHPPLYAALLWAWTAVGGTSPAWTRLLSTLCALAAVVVAHRGVRGTGLGDHLRWALTTSTAAGGFSVVYSLEARSYALLLLGSVGLTAATVRAALDTLRTGDTSRRTRLAWFAWSLLATTTHLFGAVLTLGAAAVLGGICLRTAPRWSARRAVIWAGMAAAGCSLQAAWILSGLARPGFAAGTRWIPAPHVQDVLDLLTTTLAAGGLTPHRDGFAWTSPLGVVAAAALCVAAAVAAPHGHPRVPPPSVAEGADAEARAAAVLLALAAVVIAGAFGVSQWRHLWTLRNMIVISPAVLWGIICLAAALAGSDAGRRRVAAGVVALLGAGLLPVAVGVARPYKTDARGLVGYLVGVRAQRPDTAFVFLGSVPPSRWRTAGERPDLVRAWDELAAHAVRSPSASPGAFPGTPVNGPVVVTVYHNVADPYPSESIATLVARLAATRGPASCRTVPVYGFGVVHCD